MIITVVITEFSILCFGLVRLDNEFVIKIGFMEIVEGGVVAAAVLISFGVLIGKINPLQLLVMGIIECIVVILNMYLGYTVMGVNDVGGSIFVHTFGAYFGLTVSFCLQKMKIDDSSHREGPRYTSDMFSLLGTIILWVFWPSFNGILAEGAARHRCYINTYISLMASTAWTFVLSGLLGDRRFCAEDIQNATLAGGVMVGATADMLLQPYGAMVAGSIAGIVSTVGYKTIGGKLHEKLRIHDTCGVNNLHGMPGMMAGMLSVLVVLLASEESYGTDLYKIFTRCAPEEGSHLLKKVQLENPEIEAGEGRSLSFQALVQLIGLAVTFGLAITTGAVTGLLISFKKLFEPIPDDQLFDDELFWEIADDDNAGFEGHSKPTGKTPTRRRSRARSMSHPEQSKEVAAISHILHNQGGDSDSHLHPASAAYLP